MHLGCACLLWNRYCDQLIVDFRSKLCNLCLLIWNRQWFVLIVYFLQSVIVCLLHVLGFNTLPLTNQSSSARLQVAARWVFLIAWSLHFSKVYLHINPCHLPDLHIYSCYLLFFHCLLDLTYCEINKLFINFHRPQTEETSDTVRSMGNFSYLWGYWLITDLLLLLRVVIGVSIHSTHLQMLPLFL